MKTLQICMLAGVLSLGGCATGSFSLNPADLHVAVGIGANLYSVGCTFAGKSVSECSKANQKKATAAEAAANGAIDSLPPPSQ